MKNSTFTERVVEILASPFTKFPSRLTAGRDKTLRENCVVIVMNHNPITGKRPFGWYRNFTSRDIINCIEESAYGFRVKTIKTKGGSYET